MTEDQQLELLQSVDLRTANEAVLVANTPSFLLDRLRRDSAVEYVSRSLKTDEIFEWLRYLGTRPVRIQDLVMAYVCLVALAIKDPREVWPGLDHIDLSAFQWGDQLRGLIKAEAIATSSVNLSGPEPELKKIAQPVKASNIQITQGNMEIAGKRIVLP